MASKQIVSISEAIQKGLVRVGQRIEIFWDVEWQVFELLRIEGGRGEFIIDGETWLSDPNLPVRIPV